MLTAIRERLGPGLLYAATAVGVSHLVQSTKAGATFGMIMIVYVIFICLLKYPTFLFGARYTSATGETLIDGYERMGKWILYLFFAMQLFEYTFAISAVAIVTAGLFKSILGIKMEDVPLALSITSICLGVLAVGRYALLENIIKVLVLIFTAGIVVATALAFSNVDTGDAALSAEIVMDKTTVLFFVAVAGWMPTGTAGAVGLSLWVKAKQEKEGRLIPGKEAIFDFNVGYITAIFTSVCFVALGAIVLFVNQIPLVNDGAGFSTQLIGLFTETIGSWVYPIISVAAITVMLSTLLALVDLLPRTSAAITIRLAPDRFAAAKARSRLYVAFIGVELVLLVGVLFMLMESFATFMDLVTSMGFIIAPIISLLNHFAMFSPLVPLEKRPGPVLKFWSYITITVLSLISFAFMYLKIVG